MLNFLDDVITSIDSDKKVALVCNFKGEKIYEFRGLAYAFVIELEKNISETQIVNNLAKKYKGSPEEITSEVLKIKKKIVDIKLAQA